MSTHRLVLPLAWLGLSAACLIDGPPAQSLAPLLPDSAWSDDQGGTVSFDADGKGRAEGGYFLEKGDSLLFGCETLTGYDFTWEVQAKSETSDWENLSITIDGASAADASCTGLGGTWGMGIVEVGDASFGLGIPVLGDGPDVVFTLQ